MMYEYSATLVKVLDGDTVDVLVDHGFGIHSRQRIQLVGINAAEINSEDADERVFAQAAKQRLRDLLPDAFVIRTTKGAPRGRMFATIIVGDTIVNETMLEEGFARPVI